MFRSIIIITLLVISSSAQGKKFPLSPNDNLTYYSLLGASQTNLSVNSIIDRIDNTYESSRHTKKVKDALLLCTMDASIDPDSKVVTGVKVLTNSVGVVKVYLNTSTGKETVINASEVSLRSVLLNNGQSQ
jgi:hypothetical protein